MRILKVNGNKELKDLMCAIKVDPYGIRIMMPKAASHLIMIDSISNIAANILKQEMLSLGADAAIARDALTGKTKQTDCLLIGNLSQLRSLSLKLVRQPFGLNKLAGDLSILLKHYGTESFILDLGRYKLRLSKKRTYIMGVINITPDSFSGDGLYYSPLGRIIDIAVNMVENGADILDVGGESTRPGSRPVPIKEELKRTLPAIKSLVKKVKVPVSIDTYKAEVARRALDNGASMVNDITGLRDPQMARLLNRYKAGVVIMHMKGNPLSMQDNPVYSCVTAQIIEYLDRSMKRAESLGVSRQRMIADPGIGFGKSTEDNLKILKHLDEFKALGRPLLVGTSRKSFIGKILNLRPQERISGTVASCCAAAQNGANIVRVHDVKQVSEALKVIERINNS